MLTGTQVLVLGGDARQLEVIRQLTALDATVSLKGFEKLEPPPSGAHEVALDKEVLQQIDALVLPVVGTDETGGITAVYSDEPLKLLESHISQLKRSAKVYTGLAKPYLKLLCDKQGIPIIELLERDDVAIYNSIPTAEGAVMMAMQNTDRTIHGSSCIVLGFGRTGQTLARTLQNLGADVRVGVRREGQYARAVEMGLKPFYTTDLSLRVQDIDLLFNTIPTMIVTAQIVANMPSRTVIIDLASKPGGTDFRFAQKRGIKALLAPGLPGIVAPQTAGRIIADCLCRLLLEDTGIRGERQ